MTTPVAAQAWSAPALTDVLDNDCHEQACPCQRNRKRGPCISEARAEYLALSQEVQRLREALAPFAAYADQFDDSTPMSTTGEALLPLSDCLRARLALRAAAEAKS